jgi:UDP-N-acetylmuramoyl-L-alanyl-D-glutamate--2,6-diaminopimelate ligase
VRLSELFEGIDASLPPHAGNVDVRSLAVDSRAVSEGALFAALPGAQHDGAAFAAQAVERGAAAVLSARPVAAPANVVAANPRRAFALAAARFHGDPSGRLALFGVTGTNGKTTTAYLVEQLSAARGLRTGLIGTVESRWPGGRLAATHTTPESHELQALLRRMVDAGAQVVAMEVSSHALAQERATGCTFAGAAFTNLTRDHLDYHGTLDRYFEAKARLFRELLPRGAPAVLNLDDPRCARLAAELPGSIGFTARGAAGAALSAEGLASSLDGLRFRLRTRAPLEEGLVELESPLIGAHNAENLLAALGLLLGAGVPASELVRLVPEARGAPGRLERVPDERGRIVLVDYAHTDDALARVLDAVRSAAGRGPRVLCVFGCGGDRDKGKRPLMGEAAGRRADFVVATSDNPRTEDPLAILADIEPGLAKSGLAKIDRPESAAAKIDRPESAAAKPDLLERATARVAPAGYCIVPDRAEAIRLAIALARPGDAVLIAGKGHEDYQIVGREKRAFDDRAEARKALEVAR